MCCAAPTDTHTDDAQLLNVWVEPLVHVNVRLVEGSTAADSAVIIEATNWSLHGSELIESLGLNRRFSLAFQVGAPHADRVLDVQKQETDAHECTKTPTHCSFLLRRRQARLTWTPAAPAAAATPGSGNASAAALQPAQGADMTPATTGDGQIRETIMPMLHSCVGSCALLLTNTPVVAGHVQGNLDLEVWSEVIGPFRFMPRGFLESTGSAVLGALVRGLLPPFVGR